MGPRSSGAGTIRAPVLGSTPMILFVALVAHLHYINNMVKAILIIDCVGFVLVMYMFKNH